jgi:hypothetical protein
MYPHKLAQRRRSMKCKTCKWCRPMERAPDMSGKVSGRIRCGKSKAGVINLPEAERSMITMLTGLPELPPDFGCSYHTLNKELDSFIESQKDLDPEITRMLDECFWGLIGEDKDAQLIALDNFGIEIAKDDYLVDIFERMAKVDDKEV